MITNRQIHLDFHTSPFIPEVGAEFNGPEFAKTLKEAKVTSVNIFAKCHHGMSYYPTKVGKMHPGLKRDLLGEMLEALHNVGIKAPVYFPIGWEEVSAEHTEWLEINKDGIVGDKLPFTNAENSWRKICLNKPEYHEFVKAQVAEIMDNYPVDGMWFDIIFQRNCVCNDCQKSMRATGLDPQNPEDVKHHDLMVVTSFMKMLYSFVKEKRSDIPVFFNGNLSPDNGYDKDICISERSKYVTQIEIESVPSETWGYNHFPLYVNYHNCFDKPIIGMNGKFHNAWGDFGSLRNKEALEYECFRMMMYGSNICIGDQMHPRGVLDKGVYHRIGQVYSEVEKREPWFINSSKVSEIGIMMVNDAVDTDFTPNEGAMRMMMELHQPFDFIDCDASFDKYRLIILPDRAGISEKVAKRLSDYVNKGGCIIASYHSGLDINRGEFVLPELGVEYVEENPYCPSYIVLDDEFRGDIEPLEYTMYEKSVCVKASDNKATEILAYEGKPYFNRTYDCFCSHKHFPFECLTGNPSIVRTGNVIYLSNQVFTEYINLGVKINRDIIEKCLELLMPDMLIRSNLPSSAEVAVRRQGDERLLVHILHYIPEKRSRRMTVVDTCIPLYDIKISVKCSKAPKRVYLAPDMEDLKFEYTPKENGGYVNAEIPKLCGHGIVVIE